MKNKFINAEEAFVYLYDYISKEGKVKTDGTKAIFNAAFEILNPEDNEINSDFREWSKTYAEREWAWYKSRNRSVKKLKKYAPIWDRMHGGDNLVNSNYGRLWTEEGQLDKAIQQLRSKPDTRQAWVTLFDGKNKNQYQYDTPCTLNIGFSNIDNKLNMTVLMRSNDLWYGFCNDQYCFSKLQMEVAERLGLFVGSYYHYAADLHLYRDNLPILQ